MEVERLAICKLLPSVTRAHLQIFLESRMEDKTFVGQHKRKHEFAVGNSNISPQLEKNQVVPQSFQDEALARWSTPRPPYEHILYAKQLTKSVSRFLWIMIYFLNISIS